MTKQKEKDVQTKRSKAKKYVIPALCGLIVVLVTFGVIGAFYHHYQSYKTEHAQIVRAQHQPVKKIIVNNKK